MTRRRTSTFLLALLAATFIADRASAAGNAFRILHHEPLRVSSAADASGEKLSFEAYGRRFDLELAPNERVQRAIGRLAGGSTALEGVLQGAPRSWARVTRAADGRLRGMFSDGVDVYAIEPAGDLDGALVQPADAAPADPVIFRLSDALLPLGTAQCATLAAVHDASAQKAYEAVAESAGAQAADGSPTRRLVVSVVADHEFANHFDRQGSTTAEDAIVQRMNIVDGIFAAQLGVKVELAAPTIFRSSDDPFTRTNANELLEEVRRYRASSQTELGRGLTHLMTGRDMDGETVGIAYLGSVCGGGAASSLSEGMRSTTSAALIAAHEIGHNFNAPHDGDAGGACASTPQTFLMASRLNGSQQFSSCSIGEMTALALRGHCLTEIGSAPTGGSEAVPGDGSTGQDGGAADAAGGGGRVAPLLLLLLALAAPRVVSRRRRR